MSVAYPGATEMVCDSERVVEQTLCDNGFRHQRKATLRDIRDSLGPESFGRLDRAF